MQCTHFASSNLPDTHISMACEFFMGINKWLVIWRLNESELFWLFHIALVSIQWSGSNQKQRHQTNGCIAEARGAGSSVAHSAVGHSQSTQIALYFAVGPELQWHCGWWPHGREHAAERNTSAGWCLWIETNSWLVHGIHLWVPVRANILPLIIGPERTVKGATTPIPK